MAIVMTSSRAAGESSTSSNRVVAIVSAFRPTDTITRSARRNSGPMPPARNQAEAVRRCSEVQKMPTKIDSKRGRIRASSWQTKRMTRVDRNAGKLHDDMAGPPGGCCRLNHIMRGVSLFVQICHSVDCLCISRKVQTKWDS